jgi:two-component system, chemotaxis family, CheB/CheR fusion protein
MNITTYTPQRSLKPWLAASEHSEMPRLRRRSILIADDHAESIEALALLLEWDGHEVHVALDGRDALAAARQYRPELIFLDIAMPELNGYEVCRRLRAMPEFADARIYAITAFTGEPHETRRSEAGFTGQLTKSIDPQALEQLVQP